MTVSERLDVAIRALEDVRIFINSMPENYHQERVLYTVDHAILIAKDLFDEKIS